jgi:hypothetical protein
VTIRKFPGGADAAGRVEERTKSIGARCFVAGQKTEYVITNAPTTRMIVRN